MGIGTAWTRHRAHFPSVISVICGNKNTSEDFSCAAQARRKGEDTPQTRPHPEVGVAKTEEEARDFGEVIRNVDARRRAVVQLLSHFQILTSRPQPLTQIMNHAGPHTINPTPGSLPCWKCTGAGVFVKKIPGTGKKLLEQENSSWKKKSEQPSLFFFIILKPRVE